MKMLANGLLGKAMGVLVCVMALALIEGHAAGQCVEDQKLLAFGDGVVITFGASVSISGNSENKVAIVGAPGGLFFSIRLGAAFIYRFNGLSWVEEQKLFASDGWDSDAFGASVSLSGTPGNEVAIVGEPGDDDNGQFSGSAYVFRFNGVSWVEEQKLLASDGAMRDWFGLTVSISGTPENEVAIVGVHKDDDNGTNSGSAYIYRFNGVNWIEEQKLLASDGAANDFFGASVSIGGTPGNEVAIVGVTGDDGNNTNSGSAYIYRFNGVNWVEEERLLAPDGAAGDQFGLSVAISGPPGNEVAIVGANQDDDSGSFSGSAYIFELTACSADTNCSGEVDVFDLLHLLGSWGPRPTPCPPDTNDDGTVNVTDLLLLLAAWGPNPGHAADFTGDGNVDVTDLLILLGEWGPCPTDGDVNVTDLLALLAAWGPCP